MKKIFSLLMMALLPMLASAENEGFKFADITIMPGETEAMLAIEFNDDVPLYSYSFNIALPNGVSLDKEKLEEDGEYYTVTDDLINHNRCSNYVDPCINPLSNDTIRFVDFGTVLNKKDILKKGSGPLFYIPLNIESNMKVGIYDIILFRQEVISTSTYKPDDFTGKLIVGNPATNSITTTDVTARPGKTFTLPLNLENTDEITEADFKLTLPEGVTLESAKVTSRGNGHEVDYKLRAGKYNFEVFSEKGNAFSGTEGAFVELTLKADAGIAAGDYDIQVSDISLITADDKEVTVADFTAKLTIEEPTATITASSIAAKAGKSIVLPINLENDNEITDMEFKLTLPAEVTLEGAAVTDRGADQEVSYKLRSGSYKFEVSSPAGQPFSGTEGAAVNITLKTDKTTAAGDYDIQVSDILLITKEGKEISVKDFTVKLSLTEWKQITVGDITALIDEYLEQ